MKTKSVPSMNETIPLTLSITQYAKELIHKHPGIYEGNLRCWINEKIPKATKINVELAILQLLKENYFFSPDGSVYPPNKVDENIKILSKFVYLEKLSFTDYGILYELNQSKQVKNLVEFSRKVLSHGWSEDESEIKLQIQDLFFKNIIIEYEGCIKLNWKLIKEVVP